MLAPMPPDSVMGADTLFLKSHTVTLANGAEQDITSCCPACQHYLGKQCAHGFRPGGNYPGDAYIHCNTSWWGATEERFTGGKSASWSRPPPAPQGSTVSFASGCVRSTALQTDPTLGMRYVCMCVDEISSAYATSDDGTSCGCKAGHHEMSVANVGNDDKAPGLCAQCPVGAYQPANDFSGVACISCPAGEQSKPVQRTGRCVVRSGKAPRQTDAHAFSLADVSHPPASALGTAWEGAGMESSSPQTQHTDEPYFRRGRELARCDCEVDNDALIAGRQLLGRGGGYLLPSLSRSCHN